MAQVHLQNDLAWSLITAPDRTAEEVQEALRLVASVAERAPDNPHYLNTCGLAHLRAGDPKTARSFLLRAANLYGMATDQDHSANRGNNLLHLSLARAALGRAEEALEAYERARTLAPASRFIEEALRGLTGKH